MSSHEFHLIAIGWAFLILFLTVFWYATLRRLSAVLKEHLAATRSHQSVSGFPDVVMFLFRGDFKQTGDERLVAVCRRLRQLLYGYIGSILAYVVFLFMFRSR
jgi:hypothetical protein